MKKITKVDYHLIKIAFERQVHLGVLPSLKVQGRSKKRRAFYKELGLEYNVYEGTIRRVVKSKNYAEYLRLGRENRGTSTKRKKYKTTIISYSANLLPKNLDEFISYTVEVLNG